MSESSPSSARRCSTMAEKKRLRVGVLFGGRSSEHEISLRSALTVMSAMDPARYEIVPIGIGRDGRWYLQHRRAQAARRKDAASCGARRRRHAGDAAAASGRTIAGRDAGRRRARRSDTHARCDFGRARRGVPGVARHLRRGRHRAGAVRAGGNRIRGSGRARLGARDGQGRAKAPPARRRRRSGPIFRDRSGRLPRHSGAGGAAGAQTWLSRVRQAQRAGIIDRNQQGEARRRSQRRARRRFPIRSQGADRGLVRRPRVRVRGAWQRSSRSVDSRRSPGQGCA